MYGTIILTLVVAKSPELSNDKPGKYHMGDHLGTLGTVCAFHLSQHCFQSYWTYIYLQLELKQYQLKRGWGLCNSCHNNFMRKYPSVSIHRFRTVLSDIFFFYHEKLFLGFKNKTVFYIMASQQQKNLFQETRTKTFWISDLVFVIYMYFSIYKMVREHDCLDVWRSYMLSMLRHDLFGHMRTGEKYENLSRFQPVMMCTLSEDRINWDEFYSVSAHFKINFKK